MNTNNEQNQSTISEHLLELRSRIIKSLIFFVLAFIISYINADKIYDFLLQPYVKALGSDGVANKRLIFTALQETFVTYLKLSFFSALFFSFPIFLIQIWKFIAPGLYSNEKKAILPFMIATPVLFLLGAFLAYQFIMPLAIKFFLSFESLTSQTSMPIQLEAKVSEYLSLIMIFMIAFGLSFELPVLLILLATVGFIDSKYLSERRRYIIVIIFIVAAIITPPDPISQIGLAIPLMLLYEISILIIKYLEKNKNDNT
ncbi:MAG: twin-arginine translocase subunit TatC [Pelagibacterales bacterium]|nr:twin-arginine translocase subunit TatC [Pelagibacterales bacterium]